MKGVEEMWVSGIATFKFKVSLKGPIKQRNKDKVTIRHDSERGVEIWTLTIS